MKFDVIINIILLIFKRKVITILTTITIITTEASDLLMQKI